MHTANQATGSGQQVQVPGCQRRQHLAPNCCVMGSPDHIIALMEKVKDKKPRILSISYDPSLLFTRQVMLELAGYDVVSAEGFADAIEHCSGDFDLIIMGHSIPQKDKRAIVAALHEHGLDAPLLSLLRHGEAKIPEATRAADPQDPELLLTTVKEILAERAAD